MRFFVWECVDFQRSNSEQNTFSGSVSLFHQIVLAAAATSVSLLFVGVHIQSTVSMGKVCNMCDMLLDRDLFVRKIHAVVIESNV